MKRKPRSAIGSQITFFKIWLFLTTYPPLLVNVVCERPLIFLIQPFFRFQGRNSSNFCVVFFFGKFKISKSRSENNWPLVPTSTVSRNFSSITAGGRESYDRSLGLQQRINELFFPFFPLKMVSLFPTCIISKKLRSHWEPQCSVGANKGLIRGS